MLEPLAALVASLKSATPYLFGGVALSCAFVLLAPSSWLEPLGVLAVVTDSRPYIGGALILSTGILAAQGIGKLGAVVGSLAGKFGESQRTKSALQNRELQLHKLTAAEQTYLARFVVDGENSVNFPVRDGVAAGLVAKKILYRPSSLGHVLEGFAHNLQPWARDYLSERPELLSDASPKYLPKPGRLY